MRFDAVRFHKQLEISGLATSDRFVIKASEGFSLERDDLGNGIIARHPLLKMPLWLPAAIIASADIIEEPSSSGVDADPVAGRQSEIAEGAELQIAPKRGPGRPKKVA